MGTWIHRELTDEIMDGIVKAIQGADNDELRRINLRVQAEMKKREDAFKRTKKVVERLESVKPAKVEPNANPVINSIKGIEDKCRNIIRSKNYVMTVPGDFVSKSQRYALQCAAKKFGGKKVGTSDTTYQRFSKLDKYIMVIQFPSKEDACKFMDEQHGYSKKRGE